MERAARKSFSEREILVSGPLGLIAVSGPLGSPKKSQQPLENYPGVPEVSQYDRASSLSISQEHAQCQFSIGDHVTWKGSDFDIPAGGSYRNIKIFTSKIIYINFHDYLTGSIGVIVRVFDDGDVEVEFERSRGTFTFRNHRLQLVTAGARRTKSQSNAPPADIERLANAYRHKPEL